MFFADRETTEVRPQSLADTILTRGEQEECSKEVCKPNPAGIPAGKMFNFYAHIHDFWVLRLWLVTVSSTFPRLRV